MSPLLNKQAIPTTQAMTQNIYSNLIHFTLKIITNTTFEVIHFKKEIILSLFYQLICFAFTFQTKTHRITVTFFLFCHRSLIAPPSPLKNGHRLKGAAGRSRTRKERCSREQEL